MKRTDKHIGKEYILIGSNKYTRNIDWNRENGSSPWERAKFMKELYPDVIEELPHDILEPLGESVQINTFVATDHVRDKLTRRS